MTAYYNEFDPNAAAWLRELIKHGHIAPGEVDERSTEDVSPDDLRGFAQCHFFAGIGGWSLALRNAGWPDDRPVWTGSCPCQPFSTAGKGVGFADERHLWPAFHWLIEQCRPSVVFGEQVASADGLKWLDLVSADLERADYAFGAADLCAAGVGAPHIRQRLYWVADAMHAGRAEGWPSAGNRQAPRRGCVDRLADDTRLEGWGAVRQRADQRADQRAAGPGGLAGGMADADDTRLEGWGAVRQRADQRAAGPGGLAGGMADADGGDSCAERQQRSREQRQQPQDGGSVQTAGTGPLHDFWRNADWLGCRDGKWRPVEPGTLPLAHGLPARVGRLRGYGNAIVPQVAEAFIRAFVG